MPTPNKRSGFFDSEEAKDVKKKLQSMVVSGLYNTSPSYTANDAQYPDGQMPFADKHINYLYSHPKLDSSKYLANLRLKTRIK